MDYDIEKIRDRFAIYVRDTNTWIYGYESDWVKTVKCDNWYWIGFEDMKSQPNPDYDYEDVILKVYETEYSYVVEIWHGEHSYTNDIYYNGEYLYTANPRSGAKATECDLTNAGFIAKILSLIHI